MIKRLHLLDELASGQADTWLIKAGAGFGKSVLLDQLRSRLILLPIFVRRPIGGTDLLSFLAELAASAHQAGDRDTAAAIVGLEGDALGIADALAASGRALVIDDAQRWQPEVSDYVVQLATSLNGRSLTIVSGRHVSARFTRFPALRQLGPKELSFTALETTELLADAGVDVEVASLLNDISAGWPVAVASSVARLRQASDPVAVAHELASHESLVDALLRSYVKDLEPIDLRAATSLANLPFFDAPLADMVGTPQLLDRLASAGVPINYRNDGWIEFADTAKSWLNQNSTGDPTAPGVVVQYLIDRGEIQAALTTCIGAGDYNKAVTALAGLSNDQQTRLDPSTINAMVTMVGDAVAVAPRCLLVQCQVNVTYGRIHDGDVALARAVELFAKSDPGLTDPGHMEVLLEQAITDLYEGRLDRARELLDRCDSKKPSDQGLCARIHDVRGLLHHQLGTDESLEIAKAEFTEALRLWRGLAEPRPAAVTTFRLAAGVLGDLGLRTEALELLDALPTLGPMTLINRGRVGLERSLLLPYLGRAAEVPAQLTEPRRIAQLLGLDWLTAWSVWAEVVAASIQGDASRVVNLVDEYEAAGHFLINDLTQEGMWCEVAEALSRCGEHRRAEAALQRVGHDSGLPESFRDFAAASVLARGGDPAAALKALHALEAREDLERERRWRISVLLAYCEWRLGNRDSSKKYLQQANDRSAELGQPTLPGVVEARILAEMAGGDPSPSEIPIIVEVRLFDEFAVAINGVNVDLPKGQVVDVFKLLVFGGGRATVDQVIDVLWPDADLEVGRRRLRNVLKRLRKACGDAVVRSGDSLLLAPAASSDYQRAVAAAKRCDDPAVNLQALREAIDLNQGDLLPGDLYRDWVNEARADQTKRLLKLLDAQAALAEHEGEIDVAVSALRRADALDAYSNRRLATAVRMLRDAGRDAAADALESC